MANQVSSQTSKKQWCPNCKEGTYYKESDRGVFACCPEYVETGRARTRQKKVDEMLPAKFRDMDIVTTDLFSNSKGKNLFITGPAGTGKSTLGCYLMREYAMDGKEALFVSYPEFILLMREMHFDDRSGESPYAMARKVAEFPGWLMIDDMGAEKVTDYVREITYNIINKREMDKLNIIITSNMTLDQIDEAIDSRISSRICGMCDVLELGGKDRRVE